MKKPFLIDISYTEYVPGMKLYLHQNHESLKEGDVVVIKEIGDGKRKTTKQKMFFITKDGVEIVWNEVKVSCFIERNETTSFFESMFEHYRLEADKMLKDVSNYEWTQRNYDIFLEEKYSTIIEMLIEYEKRRCSVKFIGIDWSKVNYILTRDGFKYYLKDYRVDYEAAYLGKLELFKIINDVDEIHELTENQVERIVTYDDCVVYDYKSIVEKLEPFTPNSEVLPDMEALQKLRIEVLNGSVSSVQVVVRMLKNQSTNDPLWEEKRNFLVSVINETSDTVKSLEAVIFN